MAKRVCHNHLVCRVVLIHQPWFGDNHLVLPIRVSKVLNFLDSVGQSTGEQASSGSTGSLVAGLEQYRQQAQFLAFQSRPTTCPAQNSNETGPTLTTGRGLMAAYCPECNFSEAGSLQRIFLKRRNPYCVPPAAVSLMTLSLKAQMNQGRGGLLDWNCKNNRGFQHSVS